ncbi:MAG: prolyl oligopeptidase family serine peptidase [Pirellulaceae bacterium]
MTDGRYFGQCRSKCDGRLFNPALVLAPVNDQQAITSDKQDELQQRMGVDPQKLSPAHHVRSGQPPTIIFHGKADTTVRYRTAELFTDRMKKAGNRCELIGYEGKPHGFFNFGRDNNEAYQSTLAELDRFLESLGYLER